MKSNITLSIDVDVLKKAKKKIDNMSEFIESKLKEEIEDGI